MRWQDCWCKTSADPQKFSVSFLRRLWKLDQGRIRLRWSKEYEKWVVERKVVAAVELASTITHSRKRRGIMVETDSWVQARDGYITIDHIAPGPGIEAMLIHNLQYFNLERWGGSANFLRALTEQEELREKSIQATKEDRWYNLSGDSFDAWKWQAGERVSVPRNYEGC